MTVRLVPPLPGHASRWLEWRRSASAVRHMPLVDASEAALAQRLGETSTDVRDESAQELRWMVEVDGEVVGTVAAFHISWSLRDAELGYMLAEEVHGRGIGTAAVGAMLDVLLLAGGFHRVWASVSCHNRPSQRVLEKLGFRYEGCQREHLLVQGRRVDAWIYALLRHDWVEAATARTEALEGGRIGLR